MNNVYDEAHKLARAIKDSNEYTTYIEKRRIVYSNEKNKQMVENFRNQVIEMQMKELQGKEIEQEEIEKLKNLENVLMLNPTINEFFSSELRFSQMVQDINDIIGKAIDIEE